MKKLKEILFPYFKSVRFVLTAILIIIGIYYATEWISSPSTVNVVGGLLVLTIVAVFCLHVIASWAKHITEFAEEDKNNEGGKHDEEEI